MKKGKRGRPPKQTTSTVDETSLIEGISSISLEKSQENNAWSCSLPIGTTPGGTEVKNNKFIIHRTNQPKTLKHEEKEDDIFQNTTSTFDIPLISSQPSNTTQTTTSNYNENKSVMDQSENTQSKKPQPGSTFIKTYKKALTATSFEAGASKSNALTSPISSKTINQNIKKNEVEGGIVEQGGFTPMAKRQSSGPTPEQMRINRVFEAAPMSNSPHAPSEKSSNTSGKKNKKKSNKKDIKTSEVVLPTVPAEDLVSTDTVNPATVNPALLIARAGPYSPGPVSGFDNSLFNSFNATTLENKTVSSISSPSSSSANTSMIDSPEVSMNEEYKLNSMPTSLKSPVNTKQTFSSPSFSASSFPPSPITTNTTPSFTSLEEFQLKPMAVFAPSACIEHDTGEAHQESAERLQVLCSLDNGALRRAEFNSKIEWLPEPCGTRNCEADILRVHEWDYVDHLRRQCCRAELKQNKQLTRNEEETMGQAVGFFDSDTRLSPGSWDAAQAAVAACLTAVDLVMEDFHRDAPSSSSPEAHHKAFVAVRPPGHHAGSRGCVNSHRHFWQRPDMCSCGFCLLNNVGVAAAYARYKFGQQGLRVAIVDFDIHHGNGTQEIVENILPRSRCLPLPSSWSPMSCPSFKPWYQSHLDAESVFFSSINLEDGAAFYPGDGASDLAQFEVNAKNDALIQNIKNVENVKGASKSLLQSEIAKQRLNDNIVNVTLTPVKGAPVPGDLRSRKKQSPKDRAKCCEVASEQFRCGILAQLLPKLETFNPDLIFISAGFDGHKDDFYHYLSEEDYGWLTLELVKVMAPRGGRIISVLEGGYSLEPLHAPKQAPQQASKSTSKMISRSNSNGKIAVPSSGPLPLADKDGGLVKGMMAHLHALASKV